MMLYFLSFIVGFIVGLIFSFIVSKRRKSYGVLRIDTRRQTCQVCMNTEEIIDSGKKQVILTVDRNANLSQD